MGCKVESKAEKKSKKVDNQTYQLNKSDFEYLEINANTISSRISENGVLLAGAEYEKIKKIEKNIQKQIDNLEKLLDKARENYKPASDDDDYNIDTIYYINMKNERDAYEVKDGKLVYQKDEKGNDIKGEKGYFKLLEALDSYLDDYVVTDEDSKEYDTGEKRIYVPLIIFVNDGKIVGTHTSTVKSQESGYDELTDEEYDELNGIYAEYIKELVDNYCDEAC